MSRLTIVNPTDRDWCRQRFVLSFDAHAPTHLMVWGDNLDEALETAVDWLAEHAPGLITEPDYAAAAKDVGVALDQYTHGLADLDDDTAERIREVAEADLTYTEAGYIVSWEWCITLDNPSRSQVKKFISELESRHYSDDPVVQLG